MPTKIYCDQFHIFYKKELDWTVSVGQSLEMEVATSLRQHDVLPSRGGISDCRAEGVIRESFLSAVAWQLGVLNINKN
jgi:hypothetical protein